jgi:hypothetical protein
MPWKKTGVLARAAAAMERKSMSAVDGKLIALEKATTARIASGELAYVSLPDSLARDPVKYAKWMAQRIAERSAAASVAHKGGAAASSSAVISDQGWRVE